MSSSTNIELGQLEALAASAAEQALKVREQVLAQLDEYRVRYAKDAECLIRLTKLLEYVNGVLELNNPAALNGHTAPEPLPVEHAPTETKEPPLPPVLLAPSVPSPVSSTSVSNRLAHGLSSKRLVAAITVMHWVRYGRALTSHEVGLAIYKEAQDVWDTAVRDGDVLGFRSPVSDSVIIACLFSNRKKGKDVYEKIVDLHVQIKEHAAALCAASKTARLTMKGRLCLYEKIQRLLEEPAKSPKPQPRMSQAN